jgi:hypothetical protein
MAARTIRTHKRVGEDEKLAHHRGERQFGRLAGRAEGLVLGLHGGIEAGGDQGWHVKGLAEMGAPRG